MARIPADVKVAVRDKLEDRAQFLVDTIKPNVPYDEDDRDGIHLRDSVEWHRNPREDKIGVIVTEGANDGTLGRKARANEFGRGGDNPMQARPHFFPTYRALKKKINSAVMSAGRRAIRAIWGS